MTNSSPIARRWWIRGGIAAGLLAAAWLARITVLAPDPIPVQVAEVDRGIVEATVTNTKAGTLRSRRRSRMSAETGGRVIAILHREGNHVKKGEVLVRLNDDHLVAGVELAQSSLESSQAHHLEACLNSKLAFRELQRARELAKSRVVSDEQIDRLDVAHRAAEAGCTAMKAETERSRASLRGAQAELAKSTIRAPFDGVVAEINAEIGEWVTPSPPLLSSPAVVDLLDPGSIYVSAPMDEVDSGRIRVGQRAKISVDSNPDQTFEGRVVRVAPYVLDVESQNRTVEVEVEFDKNSRPADLLAGTSADIEVVLETRPNAIRIPSGTLLAGNRVLLLHDGILEERDLEIGLRNWDYAEVVSGLAEGEKVVTTLDRKEIKAGERAVIESAS